MCAGAEWMLILVVDICDGRTQVDCRVYPDHPKNIHMAFGCDRERFVKLLKDTIKLAK